MAGCTVAAPWTFERVEPVTVKCQECDAVLAADSPSLHLELAYDDEWFVYCEACWQREFGESTAP